MAENTEASSSLVQTLPHPRLLPLAQSSPAGDAGAATHLLGEHLPRDATLQDEDDAGECRAVVHSRSTAFGFGRFVGQQRFYGVPQFVGYEFLSHNSPLPASAGFDRITKTLVHPRLIALC